MGRKKLSLADFEAGEPVRELTRELARARHERDRARESARILSTEAEALRQRLELLERLDAAVVEPPTWVTKSPGKGKIHHAIPTLLLSDLHFDEIVRPQEVLNSNAYSREIAALRLRRTLEGCIDLTRNYFTGLEYDGCTLLLGGDCLSGAIHEELEQTNEDTVYGSLDYWAEHVAAFIDGLTSEYGQVHCIGVVGNHGRRTRKPIAKRRVRDNLDWLLYRMVARATDKTKVTWTVPESADALVPIYETRYLLTHGDQFRGGTGIAGLMSPLMLGQHRKAQRDIALARMRSRELRQPVAAGFDWLVMGHWHQYVHGLGLIVNGSLKGYDEYAFVGNFRPEPPAQAMWLTTPERGATFAAPIFPMDRSKEGW